MEGKRAEEACGFARGLRRCTHRGHASFVLEGTRHCNLDLECPEYIEERFRIEPRRLFRHPTARILELHRAHRLGHERF